MAHVRKYRIRYGLHRSQFFWIYLPGIIKENTPIIVLYHGGFFKRKYPLTLMNGIAMDLALGGYIVVNVEYVRVDQGMTAVEMIKGVFDSFDFLAQMEPPEGFVVIGHSAGGYYALMLGIRNRLAGTELESSGTPLLPRMIIAQAPLADLWRGQCDGLSDEHDAIGRFLHSGITEELEEKDFLRFSPISYEPEVPVHIVHGKKDNDVPYIYSESYCQKHAGYKVFYHCIPNVDHYMVIDRRHEVWRLQKQLLLV